MLDNKSKWIDIVCYLIIFFLVLLIVLPPVLRLVLPDGDDYDNTILLESLRCIYSDESGYNKIINTQYKNKELTRVYVTYENYPADTVLEEKAYITIPGVSEDIENAKVLYTIEYNADTRNNTNLSKYFGKIDDLKATYESSSYTCNVITN